MEPFCPTRVPTFIAADEVLSAAIDRGDVPGVSKYLK
jgi:hypothetical protein